MRRGDDEALLLAQQGVGLIQARTSVTLLQSALEHLRDKSEFYQTIADENGHNNIDLIALVTARIEQLTELQKATSSPNAVPQKITQRIVF